MIKYNGKDVTPIYNGINPNRVMYNGKQIYPSNNNNVIEVQLADVVAGDVCAYDGSNKRFFRFVDSGATDDIKNYTPIGVVVVPASHTDDGTARVISLASMDYNNPDNGNTDGHVNIAWGEYGSNISTLPNLTQAPSIGDSPTELTGEQTLKGWLGLNSPEMSSDYYDNEYRNPYDTATCYGRSKACVPSPYLNDGSKNPIYHSTANTGNAYADMDGKGNTEKILDVDNSVSTDWQTASTIVNNTSPSTNTQPHTAAQCCWRYHTVGTQQGEWYLPAGGELGYLASRWKAINTSINKILSSGFEALVLPVTHHWWSSTEYSSYYAVRLRFNSSYAYLGSGSYKYNSIYVRAFLVVSPLDQSGVSPIRSIKWSICLC